MRAMTAAHRPPAPLTPDLAARWLLDPAIAFLNHGSFGATPRDILARQSALREQIESRPIEVLGRRSSAMLAEARRRIGPFIGASPQDFAFVANITEGVNAVLRSLQFQPGDELLTTTHVYNAVRQSMRHLASRAGAIVIEADVPLPLASPAQVVDAVRRAMSPRTRLLVIDHITSPTGVVFPIGELIGLADERCIDVLVDGAHAPGMVDLSIDDLRPTYYAANLHKWCCAPKGAGFLWVRPDRQKAVHPTTISHFLDQGFQEEFAWQGTRDITPWLCAADAIDFMGALLPGGWTALRQHNHDMAAWVQAMLCERWDAVPATPLDGSMLGSMATVPLPAAIRSRYATWQDFQAEVYGRFSIEVPVVDWGGRWWVRPCCQAYNRAEHYERLAEAVLTMMS
jgi:isopenicillin-N epimerase